MPLVALQRVDLPIGERKAADQAGSKDNRRHTLLQPLSLRTSTLRTADKTGVISVAKRSFVTQLSKESLPLTPRLLHHDSESSFGLLSVKGGLHLI